MNGVGLIRDRKYRLRTYRSCFQGNETVDWMVRSRRCDDRLTAVRIMRTLQKWSFFHHGEFLNLVYCKILTISQCLDSLCQFPSPFSTVCDDHNFKDELLFYRFRRDDDSIESQKDLLLFYKVLDIYHSQVLPRVLCTIEKRECLICNSFIWSILFLMIIPIFFILA